MRDQRRWLSGPLLSSLFRSSTPFMLIALLAAAGCGGQSVSKAQADRIRLGQSVADVEGILGKGKAIDAGEVARLVKPSSEDGGAAAKIDIDTSELRGLRWGSEKKFVTVVFRSDRVFRVFTQGL